MKTLLFAFAFAAGLSGAGAQEFPWHHENCAAFSGVQTNHGSAPVLAWSQTVTAPKAPWVRLEFGPTALGKGSWLALVSVSAQQTQLLNSVSIGHWKYVSSALRGGELRVELWVAPGDESVFVNLARLQAGERLNRTADLAKTLCNGDSRVNTRDDRVGRIFGGGCTAWLTANNAICTAGHCGQGNINGFFEVNVPASDSDGTANPAAPNDQFPVDDSNIRWFFNPAISDSANRGQEYSICGLLPNSNTGERAHTRGFFRLTQFVPVSDTSTLRITGYGKDNTPTGTGGDRNNDNYTEQTATGPYRGQTDDGTRVYHSYTTDTEPANSGSPMIYRTGGIDFALGIHTLGGCDPDDSSGANSGTSFNKDTLSTDINTWLGANARHMDSVAYPGVVTRTGSIFRPANNLAEGYGFTANGATLHIIAGNYPQTATGNAVTLGVGQTKSITLRAPVGTVVIGD